MALFILIHLCDQGEQLLAQKKPLKTQINTFLGFLLLEEMLFSYDPLLFCPRKLDRQQQVKIRIKCNCLRNF